MVKYECEICLKVFDKKDSFIKHTEKKKKPCVQVHTVLLKVPPNPPEFLQVPSILPPNPPKFLQNSPILPSNQVYQEPQNILNCCNYCGLVFKRKDNLKRHMESRCKVKKLDNEHKEKTFELLLRENEEKNKKINDIQKQLDELKKQINNKELINGKNDLNTKLVDIIVEKNIKIEQLLNDNIINNNIVKINNKKIVNNECLVINDIKIENRSIDNYINATQLCKAGNKKFSHWVCLDSTKELLNELEKSIKATDAGIPASATTIQFNNKVDIQNIIIDENSDTEKKISEKNLQYHFIERNIGGNDKNNQNTWIHPDLAIQLAQWISPKFAIQVSKWIREILIGKENYLNNRVKTLENICIKNNLELSIQNLMLYT